MKPFRFILRSLRHYRRAHLSVAAGAAVATMVLAGALLVGDSVRGSLRRQAIARLGETQLALSPPVRMVREALAEELERELGVPVAPVLELDGTVETAEGKSFAPKARILGVDEGFWRLGRASPTDRLTSGRGMINEELARRLGISPADEPVRVVLRVVKPGPLSREVPLTSDEADTAMAAVEVRVAGDKHFGRFDLRANQAPPRNLFVPLGWLQKLAGLAEDASEPHARANVLLVGGAGSKPISPARASGALRRSWRLADAEAELVAQPDEGPPKALVLRSRRVFLEDALADAAVEVDKPALGVLTYLVTKTTGDRNVSAYPAVAALGRPRGGGPVAGDPVWSVLPEDMGRDEIILNEIMARELDAKPGDSVRLHYLLAEGRGLANKTSPSLAVRGIRPMDEGIDAELMRSLAPIIPGLSGQRSCRDWRLGNRIDRDLIDEKAEALDAYYQEYGLTPKAFVSLPAGRAMWAGRFGRLTSIRFPPDAGPAIRDAIRAGVAPEQLGLVFIPVREQAMAAASQGVDFGQLFAYLSLFLIVAAVLLLWLLFAFAAEDRAGQIGLLLSVGLTPRKVRALLLAEGALPAAVGAVAGSAAGAAYTLAMLAGLETVWRGAAPDASISFHGEPSTYAVAAGGGLLIALAAMWRTLHRLTRRPARTLLAGETAEARGAASVRRLWAFGAAILCAAGGAVVLSRSGGGGGASVAGFFVGGALILLAALAAAFGLLGGRAGAEAKPSLAGLVLRGAGRRPWRSMATVALLACGVFVVVSIGIFRQDALSDAHLRSSGTGGFELYAETAVGVPRDLNSPAGRKAIGLADAPIPSDAVVPFRVREGDDATCLNLNRPQTPRILGVRPPDLALRQAFTFTAVTESTKDNPWLLLEEDLYDGAIPGIAEAETIQWALDRKLGDSLSLVDDNGREVRIRLVAGLANSVLQGSVIISEEHFIERFGSGDGHRLFLIDAPSGEQREARRALEGSAELRRLGLEVIPASTRLAAFLRVKNTYLGMFQVLGGLGLLLGTVALAAVVFRNVQQRRSELALLRSVGFARRRVLGVVAGEHWALLGLGLVCGTAGGLFAALPAVVATAVRPNHALLVAVIAAVLVSGGVWILIAAAATTRGRLIDALRGE